MLTQKLGIVGVGHVGEHVLAYGVLSNLFAEIVVMDLTRTLPTGKPLIKPMRQDWTPVPTFASMRVTIRIWPMRM